ncbi:hypothetical protein GF373_17920 [bacterium]|nr:hypothetical protein [bacterium]
MRWYEHMFWVSLFWTAYLPISLVIQWVLQQGNILGILAIGVFFSACLSAIAEITDWTLYNIVFRPRPAAVLTTPTPTTKKPRKKRAKKEKEVKQDEIQTIKEPTIEQSKIRTDVDLSNLDFLQ